MRSMTGKHLTGNGERRVNSSVDAPPTLMNYHSREPSRVNMPHALTNFSNAAFCHTGVVGGTAPRKINNNEDLQKFVELMSPSAQILRSPTLKANHIQRVYRIQQQKSPISPRSVNAPPKVKTEE